MLPSPSSSPRAILVDRVNFAATPAQNLKSHYPTPPKERTISRKRPAKEHAQEGNRKRTKIYDPVDEEVESESEDEDASLFEESDDELGVPDSAIPRTRERRQTVLRALSTFTSSLGGSQRRLQISAQPILQSFVSSLKNDIYNCQALDTNSFLTPPYACSYSHSKRGGSPLLAVSTEEGSVQIINTSKREPWDPEPTRTILQPHRNGIFDVKWDRTDTRIATCSGDHSSRINSVETKTVTQVLHGHTSTVKTVAWDITNDALLATGGRDGAICLWDLRTCTTKSTEGVHAVSPVVIIPRAHEDPTKPRVRKSKKHPPMPKTVTSLLFPEGEPYGLVSSGAYDGVLRFWDLRRTETPRRSRSSKSKPPSTFYSSPNDPTMLCGSKRPRGIISLAQGTGPTAGLVFGMGQDSKIHTYAMPTLTAQPTSFVDDTMQASSFYVGLALSPCGKWLACGASSPKSSGFLFEVNEAGVPNGHAGIQRAVELRGHRGEVGAVDWADGMLATCADDGTVRVWRPDIEVYRQCQANPDEAQWDWCWSKQAA